MLNNIIGIIIENENCAKGALVNSYLESIKKIFQERFLITYITSKNEIESIKHLKFLIVIGLVPDWFRNYKNRYPLIHFIADKYYSKFFYNRPVDKFNKFIGRGMLKEIYNESFSPEIIFVHNRQMKHDFEELIDFYSPNIIEIPYFTDQFNSNLKKILNLEIKENIKPYILYNSTNLLSTLLLKKSITKEQDYNDKSKYIINKPYNEKQKISSQPCIVAILNYRFNTKDYVINLHRKLLKIIIFYLINNIYLFYFSISNIDTKKDNIFFALLEIVKSFLVKDRGIDYRWKPATKLQLSAGLSVPLISQLEKSIIDQNLNNYPVFYYKNHNELEYIYKNKDWVKIKKICEIKGDQLLEKFRNKFTNTMLNVEKTYCS